MGHYYLGFYPSWISSWGSYQEDVSWPVGSPASKLIDLYWSVGIIAQIHQCFLLSKDSEGDSFSDLLPEGCEVPIIFGLKGSTDVCDNVSVMLGEVIS